MDRLAFVDRQSENHQLDHERISNEKAMDLFFSLQISQL